MKYYALKIPALFSQRATVYEVETNDRIQAYSDFCNLKYLCDPVPDLWEIVRIKADSHPYVMLVDESGLYQPRPIKNDVASFYYKAPIIGDVFILCEQGPDLMWLSDYDIKLFQDEYETMLYPLMPLLWRYEKYTGAEKIAP